MVSSTAQLMGQVKDRRKEKMLDILTGVLKVVLMDVLMADSWAASMAML